MLWSQQHQSYLRDVLIPSEPEHFCWDKLNPEALPLLESPTIVRLVHLYKLLCGVTFGSSSSSNALPLRVCLRQETVKIRMQQCEGSFVTDAPAECAVRPTSTTQVGPSARLRNDLRRNRQPFLGHYGELHHADFSLFLNKIVGYTENVKLV
jgi:hypothetical protein